MSDIEFTMHRPWAFLSPASIAAQSEESTIMAAFATAGSLATYLRNFSISAAGSSMASSMLMSITEAPPSICEAATSRAFS